MLMAKKMNDPQNACIDVMILTTNLAKSNEFGEWSIKLDILIKTGVIDNNIDKVITYFWKLNGGYFF